MTAVSSRVRTVSSAGVAVILLLVLIFGNEAFVEWVREHHPNPTTDAGDYFLHILTFPNWEFFPDSTAETAWRQWFAGNLRAILVVVFVAILLAVGSRSLLSRGTSSVGGFIFGWGATMLAAAVAGFVSALVLIGVDDGSWLLRSFQGAANGATYGLFTGWLVGAATSGARRG